MKQLFWSLSALVALAACSEELTETNLPVDDPDTYYTTPLTVDLHTTESRAFDEQMKWVWSDEDQVLVFQASGTRPVTALTHQGEGVYGGTITHATTDPADFYFGVGGSISHNDDYTASYLTPSHGTTWTPLLGGVVANTTVDAISAVELEPLTAALELRFWSHDKTERKGAITVTLKSENAICGKWDLATGEPVLTSNKLNITLKKAADTFFFNLPAGSYAAGQLTLDVTVGEQLYADIDLGSGSGSTTISGTFKQQDMTFTLPALELIKGKRTVLNVALDTTHAIITSAISFSTELKKYIGTASKIKFVAGSSQSSDVSLTTSVRGLGAYVILSEDGTTCEIHTSADDFYFEADNNDKESLSLTFLFSGIPLTHVDFGDHFNTENVEDISGIIDSSTVSVRFGDGFDTSKVTEMNYLFDGCEKLEEVVFGNKFTTANVTEMAYMFRDCKALPSLDLSSFDTGKVTNMSCMFTNCKALKTITIGEKFSTANVETMNSMFESCEVLESVDEMLRRFDTKKVTTMKSLFEYCYALQGADLTSFTFSDNVTVKSIFVLAGQNATNQPIPIKVNQAGYDYLSNTSEKTYIGYNNQSKLVLVQ